MVEEIEAPEGYKLPEKENDRKYYFKVGEGKDIIISIENKKESGGGGGGTVVPKPDPDKPVDPNKPDKPDKPVDPNKPDKPDKPVDPNKPDNPNDSGNPSKPNKPSIISKIPKTGDSAQLLATGAVFVGAGAGLFAIRRNNKKTITRSGRRSRKNRRKRK